MTQQRIVDYGAPVVAATIKSLAGSISQPGVLQGFRFSVDAVDRLRVSSGAAITNQGVVIAENESKYIQITNSSVPADYTIYYNHVDQDITGGISADLTLQSGILTPDVITGVILGYVRYPGGGIPLNTSHFVQEPVLTLGSIRTNKYLSVWVIPISGTGYVTASLTGTIDITNTYDISGSRPEVYTKIRNNGVTSGGVNLIFPFKVKEYPYALLQMIVGTDTNATVLPAFLDSAGTTSLLATSPISGVTALTQYSYSIPRVTVQNQNSIVYLILQTQMSAGREIRLQAVGLSDYNLPI